ncbi:subtilisin protease SBT3.10 [Trifolium repens]|nr:subtilisin protease SBT3.10 [Trifolium repens]
MKVPLPLLLHMLRRPLIHKTGGAAALKPGFPPAFERKLQRMKAAVYQVFTNNYRDYDNQFKTLAAVVGSEKAAKKAFLSSHGPLTTSFSAILTPDQFHRISKHPQVFEVLHDPGRKLMY